MTRINYEVHFLWQEQYLVNLADVSGCSKTSQRIRELIRVDESRE